MKRLLIYLKGADSEAVNAHCNYYEDIIQRHTKKHFIAGKNITPGYLYLTKFNPEVEVFEKFFSLPETITITINKKDKQKIRRVLNSASGLDLIKGTDFIRIEDEKNELVGLSFAPLRNEVVNALIRSLDDQI